MSLAARRSGMRKRGWLAPSEAARKAKMDRATIYRWMAVGKIKTTKVGGSRFISVASLCKELGVLAGPELGGKAAKAAKS